MSVEFSKRMIEMLESDQSYEEGEEPLFNILAVIEERGEKDLHIPATLHLLVARAAIKHDLYVWALKAIVNARLMDPYLIEIAAVNELYLAGLRAHLLIKDLSEKELESLAELVSFTEELGIANAPFYQKVADCYARHGLFEKSQAVMLKYQIAKVCA